MDVLRCGLWSISLEQMFWGERKGEEGWIYFFSQPQLVLILS